MNVAHGFALSAVTPLVTALAIRLSHRYFDRPQNTIQSNRFGFSVVTQRTMLIMTILVALAMAIWLVFIEDDMRPLGIVMSLVFVGALSLGYTVTKFYSIEVFDNSISYGLFKRKLIDLSCATKIKYAHVNDGFYLKIYRGQEVLHRFETGIDNFEGFAQCVYTHLKGNVEVELIGKAKLY